MSVCGGGRELLSPFHDARVEPRALCMIDKPSATGYAILSSQWCALQAGRELLGFLSEMMLT